jgi:lysyl-tRNA synthetase class 1
MAENALYWTDQIAKDLSGWDVNQHVVNDSKTPSGRIHIGALRGVFIHDAIFRSLKDAGLKASVKYGWDDMDALDTVPSYLDAGKFSKFIGMPLVNIPSPEEGFENYAEYFASEIIGIMKDTGCAAENYRMSNMYKSGEMNGVIRTALENAGKIREVFRKISGSDKGTEWLPIQVMCENCGKIATTVSTSFDGKTVKYRCQSPVAWAKGCGHEGEVSPFDGNAKLPWKVEWAARWGVIGVTVEGGGKDHYTKGGTRFVANALSEEVFNYRHPYDVPYEWFYIGGKKMSSSKGVGASASDIAAATTPQTLRFMMIKARPQTAIDFDPEGKTVLRIFDDYNFHESVYFGSEKVSDKKDLNNVKRAYELSQVSGVPKKPGLHVPSKILVEMWNSLPEKNREEFVMKKLADFGYVRIIDGDVRKNVSEIVAAFGKLMAHFPKTETKTEIRLSKEEKEDVEKLIGAVKMSKDAESLQSEIFKLAKASKGGTGKFFKTVYNILLSSDTGPRLGQYVFDVGKEEVISKLEKVL